MSVGAAAENWPPRFEGMVEYLLAGRIAAGKLPASVVLSGAPMPAGSMLVGLRTRCWFMEDWFDTPLHPEAR